MNCKNAFLTKGLLLLTLCLFGHAKILAQQSELQQVFPSDKNSAENFGYAVDVEADRAIIGSLRDTYDLSNQNYMTGSGAAYIYQRDGEGNWSESQKLIASDRAAGDRFSQDVGISGDYAVVSTMYRNDNKGAIYIFERNGSGIWEEKQILEAADGMADDLFGHQVDIDGDWIVVNAIWEDEDSNGLNTMNQAGSVYIYHRESDGVWRQSQKIVASDRSPGRGFGRGVAMTETSLVVGAPDAGPSYKGQIYLFERDENGIYTEKQILQPAAVPSSANFGWSVGISDTHIMANIMPYSDPGAVYVFEKNETGIWIEHSTLQAPVPGNDRFGYSIGIDGDLAVIGAHRDPYDENGSNYKTEAGSAYIYERDQSGTWNLLKKIAAPVRGDYWNYGEAVSLSGTDVLVGSARVDISAWPDPNYVDRIGSGYFYRLDRTAPTGYAFDDVKNITDENSSNYSFSLTGGEIGSTYTYVITHDGSGETFSSEGTVSEDPQYSIPENLQSLSDGALTLELYLTDESGNQGPSLETPLVKNTTPSGYAIEALSNPVTSDNISSAAFTLTDAEIGTTCDFTFTDAAGNAVSGSVTVDASPFTHSGIDLSGLEDGDISFTITLTDDEGNIGELLSAEIIKDTRAPSGYEIATQLPAVTLETETDFSFQWNNAEIGSTWNYEIVSDAGAVSISDTGLIENESGSIAGLDLSSLADGILTITFWLTDEYGQAGEPESLTIVKDATAPIASCKALVLSLDESGMLSIEASMFDDGSEDASGISAMQVDIETQLDCEDVGIRQVTLTVWDAYGNSNSCQTTLTVEDQLPPLVSLKEYTLELDNEGNATLLTENIVQNIEDNCALASLELDRSAFSCADIGSQLITIVATDIHGNESRGSVEIFITDATAPQIFTKDLTVSLDNTGQVHITPEEIDQGTTDNCAISAFELSKASFNCEDLGEQIIEFIVTDSSGNQATEAVTITVTDGIEPEISLKDIIVNLDEDGKASIDAEMFIESSSDNCGITSLDTDRSVFTCDDLGVHTIAITAEDQYGNQTMGTAELTVQDSTGPSLIVRDVTLYLDANGEAQLTSEMVDAGSRDNCGIAEMQLDMTSFFCGDEGEQIVYLMATDNAGNISEAPVSVFVYNDHEDLDADDIPDNCDPEIAHELEHEQDTDEQVDVGELVKVAEAFSPNGDGINDTWNIINVDQYPGAVVTVYNRWGNIVFQAKGYRNDWDGTFRGNNKLLPESSTYYYQIDLDADGSMDKDGWLFIAD